jgi:predicted ATP-grasp superfamily ATP-dependent carboligase
MRLLISGDEGTGTLAAVRGLRAAGYAVWLAVSRPDTYAARSRAVAGVIPVTDPGFDIESHVSDVASAAREIGAAAVLPGSEGSLLALTGREGGFPGDAVVGTCSPETLERATDKRLLVQLAREAGLTPAPTVDLAGTGIELARLQFPAILKPLRTATDENGAVSIAEVQRVEGPDQLRALLNGGVGRLRLLQPYLEGTLAAVCGVAWRGELLCAVHQRSPRIWPRHLGVSTYAITSSADNERELGVSALVRAIGWSGVFGVQFLLRNGDAYVIDFNPRIYGSLGLAIAAGANLPAMWADLLLSRGVRPTGYRPGVRYRVEEDDCRALLGLFREGHRGEALRGLLPRRRTTHGVFALSDPKPLVVSLQKLRAAARRRESPRR